LQAQFDSRRTQPERELCSKLGRFVVDNAAQIEASDPALPAGAYNRVADNWRPLFAVAEACGADWPQRAASAFAKVTSADDPDAHGIGVTLLSDIRRVFAGNNTDRISSKGLVESLCAMTDRPWPEAHRGHAITEVWLARKLAAFGIKPKTLRIGGHRS